MRAEAPNPSANAPEFDMEKRLVTWQDTVCSGNSTDTPDKAEESQELTYVDIDTFLASF